jgi:hypothetical protein
MTFLEFQNSVENLKATIIVLTLEFRYLVLFYGAQMSSIETVITLLKRDVQFILKIVANYI